jgi:hypothetical protein
MAQSTNTTPNTGARRRSQRVLMQVAVRIRGTDPQGHKVEEETETLAINAHGALVLLTAKLTSGSKIILQHKKTQEEQECHVAFLGPVRQGKAEIGLEFTTPNSTFWRVAFPPEDWTPKHPEARTASIRGEKDKVQVSAPAEKAGEKVAVPEKFVDK